VKKRFRPSGIKTVYKRKFLAKKGKKWKWRELRLTRFVSKSSHAPSEQELRAIVIKEGFKRKYIDPPKAHSSNLEAYMRMPYTKKQAKREGLADEKDYIEDYEVREEGY
jgi:hypothetical protein